ncbi:MAG: 16S rRNA (uracil(1498)-N(3))-methyltransferase [Neisseria sp.]|nr:16S rRNA (uracil(1498)-N(3))-methyltransferase [Neisseria sp.]
MPRFFIAAVLLPQQTLALSDKIVRHLHVLRCRAGDEITLFNGDGCSYPAVLQTLEKRAATAFVCGKRPSENESPLHITLIQAVSSGERMDITLQKSVELGVSEIIPVNSERSIVKLSGERAAKRVVRWQEIVFSACEQSGRDTIPKVHPLLPYRQALRKLPDADVKLLMSPNRTQSLHGLPAPQRVILMVGPEGGWTKAEEVLALAAGFQAVRLGGRVLRTETAAMAAMAAMQTLWGDFV